LNVTLSNVLEFLMSDADGNARVEIRVMPDGPARILLLDREGAIVDSMRTGAD
jgi:carotenoid cleavage dioxygenase-like enzyme